MCRGKGAKRNGKLQPALPSADSMAEVELSELPEPASRVGTDGSEAGADLLQNGDADGQNGHVTIDMPGAQH